MYTGFSSLYVDYDVNIGLICLKKTHRLRRLGSTQLQSFKRIECKTKVWLMS